MKDSSLLQSGNLSVTPTAGDASELVATLGPVQEQLAADLQRQLDLVGAHQSAAKALEGDLKALSTGLAIISGEQPLAVSLLYKRAGSGAYLKGRCWWNGHQREVQIGSISAVLAALPGKLSAPYAAKGAQAGWDDIRTDEALTMAIKEIGRRKLRELIGRRLKEHFSAGVDRPGPTIAEAASAEPQPREAAATAADGNYGHGDWYAHWREDNVSMEAG